MDMLKILIDEMLKSGVEFQYTDYQIGEHGEIGECITSRLTDISDYRPDISYNPINQHSNWWKLGMEKLAGKIIYYQYMTDYMSIQRENDWDFIHDYEYRVGNFTMSRTLLNMPGHPLYRHAIRNMVLAGVTFQRRAGEVLTLSSINAGDDLAGFHPQAAHVDNWPALAIAKMAGYQISYRISGVSGADAVMDADDFRFYSYCEFRIGEWDSSITHRMDDESEADDEVIVDIIYKPVMAVKEITLPISVGIPMGEIAMVTSTPDVGVSQIDQLINKLQAELDAIKLLQDAGYTITKNT